MLETEGQMEDIRREWRSERGAPEPKRPDPGRQFLWLEEFLCGV